MLKFLCPDGPHDEEPDAIDYCYNTSEYKELWRVSR